MHVWVVAIKVHSFIQAFGENLDSKVKVKIYQKPNLSMVKNVTYARFFSKPTLSTKKDGFYPSCDRPFDLSETSI